MVPIPQVKDGNSLDEGMSASQGPVLNGYIMKIDGETRHFVLCSLDTCLEENTLQNTCTPLNFGVVICRMRKMCTILNTEPTSPVQVKSMKAISRSYLKDEHDIPLYTNMSANSFCR